MAWREWSDLPVGWHVSSAATHAQSMHSIRPAIHRFSIHASHPIHPIHPFYVSSESCPYFLQGGSAFLLWPWLRAYFQGPALVEANSRWAKPLLQVQRPLGEALGLIHGVRLCWKGGLLSKQQKLLGASLNTTFSDGYLGSGTNEGRSATRLVSVRRTSFIWQ